MYNIKVCIHHHSTSSLYRHSISKLTGTQHTITVWAFEARGADSARGLRNVSVITARGSAALLASPRVADDGQSGSAVTRTHARHRATSGRQRRPRTSTPASWTAAGSDPIRYCLRIFPRSLKSNSSSNQTKFFKSTRVPVLLCTLTKINEVTDITKRKHYIRRVTNTDIDTEGTYILTPL